MTNYDDGCIRRAFISVSDKGGLVAFARALSACGVEIISTGGTAEALSSAGINVRDVTDVTGFPEILDGRVKSLHPKVHGALLGKRDDPDHVHQMHALGLESIDLVVCNLYPFQEKIHSGASHNICIEHIDIGGPALIRSAAKNYQYVTVIADPADYPAVQEALGSDGGGISLEMRQRLAAKAYAITASYDAAIAAWFSEQVGQGFPQNIVFSGSLKTAMRYGENPHQAGAAYRCGPVVPSVMCAEQLQGKDLSYNNINDADAAFELISEFQEPACVIVKHANPCGVAVASTQEEAYRCALSCDKESAFGGIIAFNTILTSGTAEDLLLLFAEVVVAPRVTPEARVLLATKPSLRVLETGAMPDPSVRRSTFKSIAGGILVQDHNCLLAGEDLKIVTKRHPTPREMEDLLFAFAVGKHTKSNAIIYAKDRRTVGIGAGQMSRVNASRIAALRAEQAAQACGETASWAQGSVVASDAFFPFADGLLCAAEAGVTAVIQPGGSMRDDDVIRAADSSGLAMVFTGVRHFRH